VRKWFFAISKEGKRRILDSGYVNAGLKIKRAVAQFAVPGISHCPMPTAIKDHRPPPKAGPLPPPLHRSVGGNGANKALFFPLQTFCPQQK